MTKKMILLNASPRKNKNTAQMLESVMGSPIYWSLCPCHHIDSGRTD